MAPARGRAPACSLAGDETAVPAICAIVESLPAGQRARVLLEVPTADDVLNVAAPAGVRISWLPRRSDGDAGGARRCCSRGR